MEARNLTNGPSFYSSSIGIAKRLEYLHTVFQKLIIHANLKKKNVLLGSNYQPCLRFRPISFVECYYWPYLYVWRWEWLVWKGGGGNGSPKETTWVYEDSCCIWISIFKLLKIRYSFIWISFVFEFL